MKDARLSLKWLAGMFDGDCTMTSFGDPPSPAVRFTQLDEEIVNEVLRRFGGRVSHAGTRHLKYACWSGRKVEAILWPVLPYLNIKYMKAKWMLEMVRHITGKPDEHNIKERWRLHELIRNYPGRDSYAGCTMSRQWVAGLVDADGSISTGTGCLPRLQIAQKDVRPLDAIQKRYGGVVYYSGDMRTLTWNGFSAVEMLKKLQPHLMLKHEQAAVAISIEKLMQVQAYVSKEVMAKRSKLAHEIRRLNARNKASRGT